VPSPSPSAELRARETLAVRAAAALERGAFDGAWTRAVARVVAPLSSRALARPLVVPPGLRVVTVGGATLGGSGKTRVALACARALTRAGESVVLVGHAYRARALRGGPRVVTPDTPLDEVGDEALACARALARSLDWDVSVAAAVGDGARAVAVRVVVARSRQAALDHAARLRPRPTVVVIDGPLQLAPVRAALAVLAVDRDEPWGAGRVLPAGDLRAPPSALLAAADLVVHVDALPRAVVLDDRALPLVALAGRRLGLFTALARPHRLERALLRAGLRPEVVVRAPDHGPLSPALARRVSAARVDLWLATEKCALHLSARPAFPPDPVAIFDGSVELDPAALERVSHVGQVRPGVLGAQGALTPSELPT